MKKRDVVELIRCHAEGNEKGFRDESILIARDFAESGDQRLAEYIMALLSNANTLAPQFDGQPGFLTAVPSATSALPLPDPIADDVSGIINALRSSVGVSKFLFYGPPGTGKTEAVKQVARILNRDLFMVDFDVVIDSKLGQTSKNITSLFKEISRFARPERVLVLFDEIDALALDRASNNDVREMGRATSILLRELDRLDDSIAVFATTNLYNSFDKALLRRFDACIDFGRYARSDLEEVAGFILDVMLSKYGGSARDVRTFKKILSLPKTLPYPADLLNIIKTSVAFSEPGSKYDYLRRLYLQLVEEASVTPEVLKSQGFTVREIEKLTGVSKSSVSRALNG
ncbi:MAG: AAA family ATPase [Berryella intestinalis]|uniref:AAA family ATPase n=1 Tax=Berryella intestinalis TaxID=1531429 RepID=UPI002A5855F6|nr:AAA family ATPase [Berryella intestinalis]MDD7369118.1 AAA family ATPase [Berryella intestinalis]MDY3129778.1 AAA family ATPase [Berryella intestinalis]